MKTCSGRFSWVAASNAHVTPPPPPPPSRRVPGSYVSGVIPHDSLTRGDLAGGEVEGSTRVVGVDVEYDVLGPAWRQLVLGFGSPHVSGGTRWDSMM